MKYSVIFISFFIGIQISFSQATANFHPCQPLNMAGEASSMRIYKDKPCLLDFVKANIVDSNLIEYVGKKSNYIEINQNYCDETKVVFSKGQKSKKQQITILKKDFFYVKS